jgi:Flp pilus assembly protein TadD
MTPDRRIQTLLLVALAATPGSLPGAWAPPGPPFAQAGRAGAQAFVDAGLQNLQQAHYEQAIQAFRRAVDLSPDLSIAWYDLGVACLGLQRFDESRRAFDKLPRGDPHYLFAVYFLARIDLAEGHLDAAIRGFESISGSKPLADELYYLGAAYLRNGDTPAAIHTLKRASAATPDDYRVHLLLGRAYQQTRRNQDSSAQYELSEKLRASYRAKSREILECQNSFVSEAPDAAVDHCRWLLDGDDPTKLVSLGILFAEHKLYEQAVSPLSKAAHLDPENYEPHFNLGLTYFKLKDYRDARPPLQAAVALRPESYDAIALLGSVLFAQGEDFPAVDQLRHANRLRPADEKVKSLLFGELCLIAQHLFAQKDYRQAVSYYQEALNLRPNAAELHRQLTEAQAALAEKVKAGREEQPVKK